MKSYSMDLRERVLADSDAGLSTKEVADKYKVSPAWVRRLKQRRRETGEVAARPQRHGPKPSWEGDEGYAERLKVAIHETPDATMEELRQQLHLDVALSTLWRAIDALGFSFKKSSAGGGAGPRGCQAETRGVPDGHHAKAEPEPG